jgi:hypothetical protein
MTSLQTRFKPLAKLLATRSAIHKGSGRAPRMLIC